MGSACSSILPCLNDEEKANKKIKETTNETSKETYEFGKLKKFLTLVNFMMQDTVLTLCKKSVQEFVSFMTAFCPI